MQELNKRREETLKAQKQTEEVRRKREELMAARVKAARARQRARAGLPPEEPEGISTKYKAIYPPSMFLSVRGNRSCQRFLGITTFRTPSS